MWLVIAGASAFSFAAFMGWRERRELATAATADSISLRESDDDFMRRVFEPDDDPIDWDDDDFPTEIEDLI